MGTQVALLLVCNQAVAALGPWAVATHDPGDAKVRDPLFLCVCICLADVRGGLFAGRSSRGADDEDRAQHEKSKLSWRVPLARGRRTPPLGGGFTDHIVTNTSWPLPHARSNDGDVISASGV